MKNCPKCSFENIDSAKYCINCGTRMDGNLLCPKCHNVLTPETTICPNCGTKFPKKDDDNLSNKAQEYKSKKERLNPIFQKIGIILSIIAFFIATALLALDIFTLNINNVGSSTGLIGLISSLFTTPINIEIVSKSIVIFLLITNSAITIVFSTLGIIKCFKELRKADKSFCANKELGIVLASNAASKFIIPAFFGGSNVFSFMPLSANASVAILLLPLVLMMIYRSFQLYSKNRPLIFVEKIVTSFIVYFALLLLYSISLASISSTTDGNVQFGNFDFLFKLINIIQNVPNELQNNYLNILVLEIIAITILLTIIILIISVIIYVCNVYFANLEHNKAHKIPLYFVCLFIFILSSLYLGISIFITYRFAHLENYRNVFPLSSIIMFINSSFLFAFSLLSLNFTRKIVKQDKIIKNQEELLAHK